jgi:hypothetical protein
MNSTGLQAPKVISRKIFSHFEEKENGQSDFSNWPLFMRATTGVYGAKPMGS